MLALSTYWDCTHNGTSSFSFLNRMQETPTIPQIRIIGFVGRNGCIALQPFPVTLLVPITVGLVADPATWCLSGLAVLSGEILKCKNFFQIVCLAIIPAYNLEAFSDIFDSCLLYKFQFKLNLTKISSESAASNSFLGLNAPVSHRRIHIFSWPSFFLSEANRAETAYQNKNRFRRWGAPSRPPRLIANPGG